MKKTLLTLLLASMLAMTARGQVLQNTYWTWYDQFDSFSGYILLGQDTLYISPDNINYDSLATFTTSVNLFTIVDITLWQCLQTDTGRYTFSIQADTLRFTIISDPCATRNAILPVGYFVRFYTGIEENNPISGATISPNPSATGIFNVKFTDYNNMPQKIYVLNVDGRKIMEETFSAATTNHTINLQSCASGIYFLVTENEKGRRVYKLAKQ